MAIDSPSPFVGEYAHPRRRHLFEGTGKILYEGPEPGTCVWHFKDDVAVESGISTVSGKGVLNNRISDLLMSRLNELGFDTHFIRTLNMREQLVRKTEALPFSVTLHNVAFGAFAKRLGLEEGIIFSKPLHEFFLRSPELGNPVVATEHLTVLGWSRFEEIDDILLISQRINDFLTGQFLAYNMRLVSFTLEFGRLYVNDLADSQVILGGELSPDTLDLLDLTTGKRLGRHGIQGTPEEAQEIYRQVASRLGVLSLDTLGLAGPSQDSHPAPKPCMKKYLVKRKNPHGHNSF